MGLESATYIAELLASNPPGNDFKSQGDDHLRLIKSVLQATFPNASRAFRFPSTLAAQATNITLDANNANTVIPVNATAATRTVTLPNASQRFDGISFTIIKSDSSENLVIVDGDGSDTINGSATYSLTKPYQQVTVVWNQNVGGWFATTSPSAVPTGVVAPYAGSVAPSGWVLLSGVKSIGSAGSGATERANADTENLYTLWWNSFSNSVCPVAGGRGASAAADFAANKAMTTPDLRGRTIFGKDDMGGTSANRITNSGSGMVGTTLGTSGGAETVTLAALNLPDITIDINVTDPGHTHTVNSIPCGNSGGNLESGTNRGSNLSRTTTQEFTGISVTGAINSTARGGAQTATNKMPPTFICSWIAAL